MPISHLLEDFGALRAPQGAGRTLDEEELEDFRLAAFEQGYSAGWEDAVKAQTEDQNRVSAELARNLEDLSFTYHEAVNQLMLSSEPVFRALVERVLPQTLTQQFGGHILERIRAVTEEEVAQPVTLAVAPGEGAAVRALLRDQLAMPVKVREDPALEAGQADLRIGESESRLDTALLTEAFEVAVDAFFHQTRKESGHG